MTRVLYRSMMHLLTMYFLDSGAYSKGYLDWFGVHPTAYDWIHTDQIDWFLQESGEPVLRFSQPGLPFTYNLHRLYQADRTTVHA